MYPRSMEHSDCIVVMGSNMAENHPVAFRWPMNAKVGHGAKIIHVDPRFTRTSAVADIYAPLRAGSDIAFLGALVRHVITSERWNDDPFFRSYVVNYTNAATIIDSEFRDAEDNDGVFSGLMEYNAGVPEWPVQRVRRALRRSNLAVRRHARGGSGQSRGHRPIRRNAGNNVGQSARGPHDADFASWGGGRGPHDADCASWGGGLGGRET